MLALHLSADLKLFASPLYMAMIAGLGLLLGVNIAVLTLKRATLRRGNPAVMMALALVLRGGGPLHQCVGALSVRHALCDRQADGVRRRLIRLPCDRAFGQRAQRPDDHGRGARTVRRSWRQSILLQPFQNAELLKRYDVSVGITTYYGSTTAAEMRELCSTRESYETLLEGEKYSFACRIRWTSAATRRSRCTTSPATSSSARTGTRSLASRSSSFATT